MTTIPFIYKYQPQYLDNFQIRGDLKNMFKVLLETNNMNILLVGDCGSGKTTLINALLREYYKKNDLSNNENILYINTLKDQGIQYYRNDVKTFCQTMSNVKKTVVLDDIDLINDQSQQVFRNCMDKYGKNVFFICSCNNIQKVVETLQSRINCIKINPLNKENLYNILYNIIDVEQLTIDQESIDFIIKISNHSATILINYLEKLKLLNIDITFDICLNICTNVCFSEFNTYTNYCKNRDINNAIKVIYSINDKGFSVMDILDNYFLYIKYTDILTEKCKFEIIKLLMKYITIFHTIHEDEIELVLFTNNLIKLF